MAFPSKPVIQYSIEGEVIAKHLTLAAAAKAAKVTKAALSIFLNGKRKTPVCAGYVWRWEGQKIKEPAKTMKVDPHSDAYKWDSFAQKIQRRIKLENETRKRNISKDY